MRALIRDLRESFMTWPCLSIKVELFPWHWRIIPWGYADPCDGLTLFARWLFVELHLGYNNQPFLIERSHEDPDNRH